MAVKPSPLMAEINQNLLENLPGSRRLPRQSQPRFCSPQALDAPIALGRWRKWGPQDSPPWAAAPAVPQRDRHRRGEASPWIHGEPGWGIRGEPAREGASLPHPRAEGGRGGSAAPSPATPHTQPCVLPPSPASPSPAFLEHEEAPEEELDQNPEPWELEPHRIPGVLHTTAQHAPLPKDTSCVPPQLSLFSKASSKDSWQHWG